ncbi:MAG: hypothetical protein HW388_39 [Dehalococcoidia bacterium]|nr:hypothetical protein [Dehalococcoidia bacterium]
MWEKFSSSFKAQWGIMTSYSAYRESLDLSSLFSPRMEGQPQPWSALHLGVPYPGEVIVASRWDDSWGKELTGECYFRIILLTSRSRLPLSSLRDARIVACIPSQEVLRQRESLDRELRSIAEARGLYVTRRQADSSALRSSLEQREVELRGEFLEGCSRSYGSGQIVSAASLDVEPGRIFAASDPALWLRDLAGAILARVYPTLPIESGAFSRPLLEEELQGLFDTLMAGAPPATTDEAMASFAVGLGLARRGDPSAFDPPECAVFELIRRELERRGPRLAIQDITQLLGHSHGLPLPLVALFLLAFVKHSHPETELDLAADHSLVTRDRNPFPGDRLTWEMVGQIRWHRDMYGFLTSLHLPEPPLWNTALPFIRVIDPGAERAAPSEVPSREAALLPRLRELSEAARQALVDIRPLLDAEEVSEAESRLQALISLGQSADYQQFYRGVRESFQGPRSLARERHLPAQARLLKAVSPQVSAVRSYLKDMTFGPQESALSLNQRALLLETSPIHILENPALWPAIDERFERLRQAYRELYIRHHAQYRKEASALWARLQHALPLVEALEQLNSIAELGLPVGADLPYQFEALNTALKMCPAPEEEVQLEERPMCPYCGLRLSESIPHQEIEAIQEQNRRLSLHGIQQILGQEGEGVVDKLIRIVRIADLTPLSSVLSPQVVAFLRSFATSP